MYSHHCVIEGRLQPLWLFSGLIGVSLVVHSDEHLDFFSVGMHILLFVLLLLLC